MKNDGLIIKKLKKIMIVMNFKKTPKQQDFILGLFPRRGEKNMRPEGCKMNQMTVTVETSSKTSQL